MLISVDKVYKSKIKNMVKRYPCPCIFVKLEIKLYK